MNDFAARDAQVGALLDYAFSAEVGSSFELASTDRRSGLSTLLAKVAVGLAKEGSQVYLVGPNSMVSRNVHRPLVDSAVVGLDCQDGGRGGLNYVFGKGGRIFLTTQAVNLRGVDEKAFVLLDNAQVEDLGAPVWIVISGANKEA